MKAMSLQAARIKDWIQSLLQTGSRVVAPVRVKEDTLFSTLETPEHLVLDERITLKSAKGVFFPQSEVVLEFEAGESRPEVKDIQGFAPQTILLGVRPCDVAAMNVLDSVFAWDYKDNFYLERRANTTIVSVGCLAPVDEFCFCTSVGLNPQTREGSDVFMLRQSDGSYLVEAVTEKGEALLKQTSKSLELSEAQPNADAEDIVPRRFDLNRVKPWLDEHFDDDFWKKMSLKCIGCGTCTFLCPTCHCFDLVDETRQGAGVRRKNWDSCQFSLFTLHASGHNPRKTQSERYRQRIMHKFKYYQEKFGKTLCVGCGRCVRSCPVGHSLLEYLTEIDRLSREAQPK